MNEVLDGDVEGTDYSSNGFFFKEKFLGLRLGKNWDSEFSFRKGSNILSPLGYSKF